MITGTYLFFVPLIAVSLLLASPVRTGMRTVQYLFLAAGGALAVLTLNSHYDDYLPLVVLMLVTAELLHFAVLGLTGLRVPVMVHKLVLVVPGLFPVFLGVTAGVTYAVVLAVSLPLLFAAGNFAARQRFLMGATGATRADLEEGARREYDALRLTLLPFAPVLAAVAVSVQLIA